MHCIHNNKANLRDLIAAADLVILLKLDSNHQFLAHVTLKFDGRTKKITGHLFYTTSSFVNHFIVELKTRVIVWKRSIPVKIGDFLSRVVLKFDGWPWKTEGHLFYATLRFVHHFKAIVNSNLSCSPETLNLRENWEIFLSHAALKFNVWPWNTIGHQFYVASIFVHHFIAISEFQLKLQSGNAQFGWKWAIFCPVWP